MSNVRVFLAGAAALVCCGVVSAQVAPTATTSPASGVTSSAATLNGVVNANGSSTSVSFEYGTSTSYGTTVMADQSPVTGSVDTAVTTTITGLPPGVTFHFRVVGANANGTTYGADMTFVTGGSAPAVTTGAATDIVGTTATLNGTVNANGSDATVVFEYGTDISYGTTVPAVQSPVGGTTTTAVSAAISGLATFQTYHFRVVATNGSGTVTGSDMTFGSLPVELLQFSVDGD